MDENKYQTMNESPEPRVPKPPKERVYNNVTFFKVFTAVCALLLAAMTAICFITCFGKHGVYLELSPIVYVWCGLIALTVISTLILCIISRDQIVPTRNTVRCGAFVFVAGTVISTAQDKNWLLFALAILAMLYFTEVLKNHLVAHTFVGFASVAWCVAIIAQTYFNYDMPVNAPYKLLCQFGVALGMILILSNMRFALDAGKTGIYKFFCCLTLCINLSAIVAGVIITVKKPGAVDLTTYVLPALAFTAYALQIFPARPKTDEENEDTIPANDAEEQISESEANTENTLPEDTGSEKGQDINEDND